MKEIVLYLDHGDYFLKQQAFSSFDYLKSILLEEIGINSGEQWIKDLSNPIHSEKIGLAYAVYKEGNMAYIYHDIYYDHEEEGNENPYAYRKGFAIPLDKLFTIFKHWIELKKEQWDEIILQQDEHNNITLFGRNYDPDVPVIMQFYREAEEDHEYTAECAYGRYEEIRLYFIYETPYAVKWLAFLKNPQKKKFKGSTIYAQKVNNEIHLCYSKPSIQKNITMCRIKLIPLNSSALPMNGWS